MAHVANCTFARRDRLMVCVERAQPPPNSSGPAVVASAEAAAALLSQTERQRRATEEAALYCGPEALEADGKYVHGANAIEAAPITVEVPGGTRGSLWTAPSSPARSTSTSATTSTSRTDRSHGRRYIAEAHGGYHFDVLYRLNIDAGIFLSYVGLCSYYDYENWTDQASYVSSNTPWFFEGIRIQLFTSDRLKIEPWIINGWQSYGMYNEMPGLGFQVQWRPYDWLATVFSAYTGADTEANPGRLRFHTDNSVLIRYFQSRDSLLSKGAVSITMDAGCENGGGVSCFNGSASAPTQYFFGWMVYDRLWFFHDHVGFTGGGGQMSNPGRYLVLTRPSTAPPPPPVRPISRRDPACRSGPGTRRGPWTTCRCSS